MTQFCGEKKKLLFLREKNQKRKSNEKTKKKELTGSKMLIEKNNFKIKKAKLRIIVENYSFLIYRFFFFFFLQMNSKNSSSGSMY